MIKFTNPVFPILSLAKFLGFGKCDSACHSGFLRTLYRLPNGSWSPSLRSNVDGGKVWAIGNPYRESIWQLQLDAPNYSNSYLHDAAIHIYTQKSKFNEWLENYNPEIVANTLLLLCLRVNKMLQAQIQSQLENFRHQGGFTENMTVERLNARKSQASASGAPSCPKCGNPMLKRIQKKGRMQGREFWDCSDYPKCDGTLPIDSANPV